MAAATTQHQPPPLTMPQALPMSLPSLSSQPYSSQASITPPDSDSSSPREHSSSPRSPLSNLPAHLQMQSTSKQLQARRVPLYVPAVLRPTEKPARQSPPKRGQAVSPGLAESQESISDEEETSSMSRIVTEEWNEDRVGDVTGPPSRNHWKPDPSSLTCDSPTCTKSFTLFLRRHHCRRCGSIFCGPHSGHQVPLDQHARFHPSAPEFRACDSCWRDFGVWNGKRIRLRDELQRSGSADGVVGKKGSGKGVDINAKKGLISQIAQSVPRDWSWSTF